MGMIGGGEGVFIGVVYCYVVGLDGYYIFVCGVFSCNEENNFCIVEILNVVKVCIYDNW